MQTAEVVIGEMQCDCGLQVLQALAESVCQAGESTAHHPKREILALYIRGRDVPLGHYHAGAGIFV